MLIQAVYYAFRVIIYTNSHSNSVRYRHYSSHFNFQNMRLEEVL